MLSPSLSTSLVGVKKVKITFFYINMGASEAAISKKVLDKLKIWLREAGVEVIVESHFYHGEWLWQEEVVKGENKKETPKKYTPNVLKGAKDKLNDLINKNTTQEGVVNKDNLVQDLRGNNPFQLTLMSYFHQNTNKTDLKLLKAYDIEVKRLAEAKEIPVNQNENTIEIRILSGQTASCSLHSTSERKKSKSKATSKQQNEETEFFNDFQKALNLFHPDNVICENTANIPEHVIKRITDALSKKGLKATERIIEHDQFTATRRKRLYIIASKNEVKITTLPTKPRRPIKYLYNKFPVEAKYTEIKNTESITTALREVKSTRKTINNEAYENNQHIFDILNPAEFIKLLRLHIVLKRYLSLNDNILLLPNKIRNTFPKKNGEERSLKRMGKGVKVKFGEQHGSMGSIMLWGIDDIKFDIIQLVHSSCPTPTLVHRSLYIFWDLDGYNPTLGEIAKIEGMSNDYTKKLVSPSNDIKLNAISTLSHNLSTKVVGPIVLGLIESTLEKNGIKLKKQEKTEKPSDKTIDLSQKISMDLAKDIDINNYALLRVRLKNSTDKAPEQTGDYVYFVVDKLNKKIVDQHVIITPLSLKDLHNKGYIINNELSIYPEDLKDYVIKNDYTVEQKPKFTETEGSSVEAETKEEGTPPAKRRKLKAEIDEMKSEVAPQTQETPMTDYDEDVLEAGQVPDCPISIDNDEVVESGQIPNYSLTPFSYGIRSSQLIFGLEQRVTLNTQDPLEKNPSIFGNKH